MAPTLIEAKPKIGYTITLWNQVWILLMCFLSLCRNKMQVLLSSLWPSSVVSSQGNCQSEADSWENYIQNQHFGNCECWKQEFCTKAIHKMDLNSKTAIKCRPEEVSYESKELFERFVTLNYVLALILSVFEVKKIGLYGKYLQIMTKIYNESDMYSEDGSCINEAKMSSSDGTSHYDLSLIHI